MVDGPDDAAYVYSDANTAGEASLGQFITDQRESAKLDQFYPSSATWWEGAAKYGLTRALDAAFGPAAVDKTAAGSTYAGANGKTYANGTLAGGSSNGLVLILLAGAAFFALS